VKISAPVDANLLRNYRICSLFLAGVWPDSQHTGADRAGVSDPVERQWLARRVVINREAHGRRARSQLPKDCEGNFLGRSRDAVFGGGPLF